MQEIWKDIEGYEGLYEVSSFGRVRSLKYGNIKILKSGKYREYSRVSIWKNNNQKTFSLHRLVAKAFIPNSENKPMVCHKDEKLDENGLLYNGSDNLFWGTNSDNTKDKFLKGRANNHFTTNHPCKGKFGKNHYRSKSIIQSNDKGEFIKEWGSITDATILLGINQGNISSCCRGKLKFAGGFIWKYKR